MAKSAENMPSERFSNGLGRTRTDRQTPGRPTERFPQVSGSVFSFNFVDFSVVLLHFCFGSVAFHSSVWTCQKFLPHLLLKGAFHFTNNFTQYAGVHFSDELFAHLCILLQIDFPVLHNACGYNKTHAPERRSTK